MKSIRFINISCNLFAISQSISLHRLSEDQPESNTSSSTNQISAGQRPGSSTVQGRQYSSLDILRHRGFIDMLSSTKVRRSLPPYQQNQQHNARINYPPRVGVLFQHDGTRNLLQVSLGPNMSAFDSLTQARLRYSLLNPTSMFNPYELDMKFNRNKTCAEITSVGTSVAVWMVKVTNRANEVIHEDTCIPKRSNLIMRPGYNIEVYKL